MSKVAYGPGCHEWRGALVGDGYGQFSIGRKRIPAHRFAYESSKGPIPKGLTIDHLCRNLRCVNPLHLEAVTLKENILRGTSFSAKRAKQTQCKHGHTLDLFNTR